MAASASAEAAVKKLARLPANTACPNCGTQKKFGFSTVCIKYLTFVCNNCKASHQAISHRCKSLTMSSWTEGEVLALKKAGNEKARATWLAKAPPPGQGGRPKEGDHVDVFKAFIVDVYERKRYFEEGGVETTESTQPVTSATKATASPRRPYITPTPNNTIGAPAAAPPAPPAVADLLDFGAFDSTPASAPMPQQIQPFNAFGDFSPTPAAQAQTTFPPAPSSLPPAPANLPSAPSDPFSLQPAQQKPPFDPFSNNIGSSGAAHGSIDTSKPPAMKNVTGLSNTPTPVMGMTSARSNPSMMQQSNGNGLMGGQPVMGNGSQFMNNMPMMMNQSFQMANNPQSMMMMNAQQQMMMNQMNRMSGNMFPQQAWPSQSTIGNNNMGMMNSMGSNMSGSTQGFSAPSQSNQISQQKTKDPFSDLGL